ncbi:MAG: VOC family protein [Phaeodactylibacter sp.]|nr:VOC family protein [Phaeodactylibacter sp.]
MQKPIISGIQQMGIGIPNVHEAFKWYRRHLTMDIPVFEEAAEANLMLPYTDNQPQTRHAILAINPQGGGGLEIWQYTGRTPQPAAFDIQLGDLGLFITKFKAKDVGEAYARLKQAEVDLVSGLIKDPAGHPHFYLKDPYGNLLEVVQSDDWFRQLKDEPTGGVYGAVIGVSDIERSMRFYKDILGYDKVLYDESGAFGDFSSLPSGTGQFRRVLLTHSAPRKGSFSRMLGSSEIELVQALDRKGRPIFENRLWGDLGYIHLCFDINGMDELRERCAANGHPFTVDSAADRDTFDMGEAAGNFSYIEDPDGALIEFVETHKVPIAKKFGWYLNLRKRNPEKPLPDWMLKAMALNRVRN